MHVNALKQKLQRGEPGFGVLSNLQAPAAVEILASLGLDFIIVDAEHTAVGPETAENLFRAAELKGTTALTRVGENSRQVIQKYMDAGSMGVLMPLIESPADVRSVVDAVKYPPVGRRGLASTRASGYGLEMSTAEYVRMANEETLIAIQIETQGAIDHFEDILAVDEVDIIFFGPTDISAVLGIPGQIRHPRVTGLIAEMGGRAVQAGKVAATLSLQADDYLFYRERGFLLFVHGTAQLLIKGTQAILQEIRDAERGRTRTSP